MAHGGAWLSGEFLGTVSIVSIGNSQMFLEQMLLIFIS
jgi:hypothetical protein